MLPALRNLNTTKSELEHEEAKGKILAGQLGNWAGSPAIGDALQLAASIDGLTKTVACASMNTREYIYFGR